MNNYDFFVIDDEIGQFERKCFIYIYIKQLILYSYTNLYSFVLI